MKGTESKSIKKERKTMTILSILSTVLKGETTKHDLPLISLVWFHNCYLLVVFMPFKVLTNVIKCWP